MLDRRMAGGFALAAFAVGSVAVAQSDRVNERFTFSPPNATETGSSDAGPWEIVVDRWSTDDDREVVLEAASHADPQKLHRAISRGSYAGHIRWPGYLQYTIRYAHRIARPDGAEDVILATDRPVWMWWDPTHSTSSTEQPVSVIRLRLNPQGAGEGKLSLAGRIAADAETGALVLEDSSVPPVTLQNVRRTPQR